MRMLGIALGLAQRAVASGARVFEILDREPRVTSAPGAPPLPAGGGRVELRDVTLRLRRRAAACCRTSTSTVEAGRTVALVGATGVGQDHARDAAAAPLRRHRRAACSSTARTCARSTSARCAARSAVVSDDPFLFSASVRENIAYARPEATRRGGRATRRARAQARGVHRASCPKGYETRIGERGLHALGRPAPADRDRPGAAHGPAHPRSSTTPPRAWTRRPRAASAARSRASMRRAGRRSSSPTGCRRSRWPTRSWCSRTGEIVAHGTPRGAARRVATCTAEIAEKGLPDQVFLTRKPLEASEAAGL